MTKGIDMRKISEFQVNGWAVIVLFCICMAVSISSRVMSYDALDKAEAKLAVAQSILDNNNCEKRSGSK